MKIDSKDVLGLALLAVGVALGAHMILYPKEWPAQAWYFIAGISILGALFVDSAKVSELFKLVLPWKK